ncbi:MAG: hypothetical protein ACFFDB_00145 [Promethearchaeota archaeon]
MIDISNLYTDDIKILKLAYKKYIIFRQLAYDENNFEYIELEFYVNQWTITREDILNQISTKIKRTAIWNTSLKLVGKGLLGLLPEYERPLKFYITQRGIKLIEFLIETEQLDNKIWKEVSANKYKPIIRAKKNAIPRLLINAEEVYEEVNDIMIGSDLIQPLDWVEVSNFETPAIIISIRKNKIEDTIEIIALWDENSKKFYLERFFQNELIKKIDSPGKEITKNWKKKIEKIQEFWNRGLSVEYIETIFDMLIEFD